MQNKPDKVLIDRIQAGDTAAFEAMVIQYRPRLIASLIKYTKSVELSEDIAQQTFIKVWQKIDTFRGESALFTWIYRIAINLAKNAFNSKSARNDDITDNLENIETLTAVNESPEAFNISLSLRAELDNFLRQLPIDLKTAFLLREDEGKSYEQIATIMDCPIGTVRSRIFRARELILEKFDEIN
tara:strand:- start:385 stop:939 length:555 start_codon:yes stop_codon:yes gene_type:complete